MLLFMQPWLNIGLYFLYLKYFFALVTLIQVDMEWYEKSLTKKKNHFFC